MDFSEVNTLEDRIIQSGEKVLYIADFNTDFAGGQIKNTGRIDSELEDIRQISRQGGIVLILAHKGRFKDGDVGDLEPVADYLSGVLGIEVQYCLDSYGETAVLFSSGLKPGEVAVMGNVRKHPGEEANNPDLAESYSHLGDIVAVGGFGKTHREEASNNALLDLLPAYLARSQAREMELLSPWAGESELPSLAVLGGLKKEKIDPGLTGLVESYDWVLPGGIVLHTILNVLYPGTIGSSPIQDKGKSYEHKVKPVLDNYGDKILIPDLLIIAQQTPWGFINFDGVLVGERIPETHQIVTQIISDEAKKRLDYVANHHGRIVVAGTPDIYFKGMGLATNEVLGRMNRPAVQGLVLGGDTAAELKYSGTSSTGGGSALYFLAHGTTPVFEKLKANKAGFLK